MANLYYFLDMRRPNQDGRGSLRVALQHRSKVSYFTLDSIHLRKDEWDATKAQVVGRPDKKFLNVEIRKVFSEMTISLNRVILRKDFESLTSKEIMDMISRGASTVDQPSDLDYVVPVYNEYITLARKTSTAQVYRYSLNNLIEYCAGDIDSLKFGDITGAWLRKYQNWLLGEKGMSVNGANVYLRNLRTIFNYALNNQFTGARYPFRDIDMGVTETEHGSMEYEKFLEWATLPMPDSRNFYRDLFMLSFYLCGIRPVDLLHAKKSQVHEGRLIYKPEKLNGKTTLSVKIEPEAWDIIKRYEGEEYLLNVMESRTDYKSFMWHWNAALKAIGEDIFIPKVGRCGKKYTKVKHKGIVPHITIYYARRCFATYCYNILDIPMDTISQAMGHKNGLRVTNLYVRRDTKRVDEANRNLIDRVTKDMAEYAQKHYPKTE